MTLLPHASRADRDLTARVLSLWPWALLLAAGSFVLLPRLGAYGFWDPWEPKYAEAAREMLERRTYFVPY